MAFANNPSVYEVLQVPGYLHWNPTGFENESQWGDKLGFCSDGVQLEPGQKTDFITFEETGEEPQKWFFLGNRARFRINLRSWNQALVSSVFFIHGLASPTRVLATSGRKPGIEVSSTVYSKPLLYVPQDNENSLCVLFYRAKPDLIETARLIFSHSKYLQFPCVFEAVRAGSNLYYVGPLSGA